MTATAHHLFIQKEVDELLAKNGTETLTGSAGFTQMFLCFPKNTGGFKPILNLK